jgi:hypothetical protein
VYAVIAGLVLLVGTAAPARSEESVSGVVANVDVARGVVVLRNGTAWHVGNHSIIQSHDQLGMVRPLALGQIASGSTVTLRNVEPESAYASPRTDTTPGSGGPQPGLR